MNIHYMHTVLTSVLPVPSQAITIISPKWQMAIQAQRG